MKRRRVMYWLAGALLLLILAVAGLRFAVGRMFDTDQIPPGAVEKQVTSRDGTVIAYEQTGSGPTIVLVGAALSDRGGARRLGTYLAAHFTVINYDRRGRGRSTDTQPYTPQREAEDIAALVEAAGGSAYLFGSSSGAALALDAAQYLGPRVRGVFLYEPPFMVDNSRPPVAADLIPNIVQANASGHPEEAVRLFFVKGMGIPSPGVIVMRLLMPNWSRMIAMAPTLRYDLTLLEGTQSGKPLPATRWTAATMPMMVMVGGRSEPFFHQGAKALAGLLPNVKYSELPGKDHSAVLTASQEMAAAVERFALSAPSASAR